MYVSSKTTDKRKAERNKKKPLKIREGKDKNTTGREGEESEGKRGKKE